MNVIMSGNCGELIPPTHRYCCGIPGSYPSHRSVHARNAGNAQCLRPVSVASAPDLSYTVVPVMMIPPLNYCRSNFTQIITGDDYFHDEISSTCWSC